MLNLSALNSLVERNDVIVVASVAAIYATSPPNDFFKNRVSYKKNQMIKMKQVQYELVNLNYQRNDIDVVHGKFSVKGDVLEIGPGYCDEFNFRISFFGDVIEDIAKIDPLTKKVIEKLDTIVLPGADLYLTNKDTLSESLNRIQKELEITHKDFLKQNKLIEAQRILERTTHDIESFKEFGYCSGIENYSRHLELRAQGQTPYTLFDYFDND